MCFFMHILEEYNCVSLFKKKKKYVRFGNTGLFEQIRHFLICHQYLIKLLLIGSNYLGKLAICFD